ncbi:hypothetical protein A9Q99_12395 [Gammaproteobacteria bacterium 45_16_T64]|nr:hypothetical protein A9Q99_12395 [Gammaproteobacteria bacterium 45_16_T64]
MERKRKAGSVSKGLTLVELMVALAISSFLILGIFQIYSNARVTDKVGQAVGRVQETGRVVLDMLSRDLRMVGYYGCIDPRTITSQSINVVALNSPITANDILDSSLQGFDVASGWAVGTQFDNTDIAADAIIGSDVVAIQRMRSSGVSVASEDITATTITLESKALGVQKDSLVLVANCNGGHVFRVTNDVSEDLILRHDESGNTQSVFSAWYGTDASVMGFVSSAYFVADTGRNGADGADIFALYRQYDTSTSGAAGFEVEEIVEGVESLQIEYGERVGDGNIRFVPASTDGLDMLNVESIRIAVLVSSTDNVLQAEDELTYSLLNESVVVSDDASTGLTHSKDRRVRQVFRGTINLRNRPISKDS